MMVGRGRPSIRANSIKQFICRFEAPPEGTSHSRRRFSPRVRVRVFRAKCAPIWRSERELEKDQEPLLPVPGGAVASRYNTMLLMLRLQFRHNFLSRGPFGYRMPGLLYHFDKENVISGCDRLDNARAREREKTSRESLYDFFRLYEFDSRVSVVLFYIRSSIRYIRFITEIYNV